MKAATTIARGWILTLAAAGLLVGYVLGDFVPRQKSIISKRRHFAEKQKVVAQAATQSPSLEHFQKQFNEAKAYVTDWQRTAAVDPNLVDIVGKLSAIAHGTGVRVSRLTPQERIPMAVLRQHPLALTLEGDFEQISEFLAKLESLDQAIWVRRLGMKRSSEDGNVVECELMLSVFADNREVSG